MIGVLVSGEGSNLQALFDHGVRAIARAEAAGVPTAVFAADDFATREDRDRALADWLESHDVELVVLAGYMHLLRPCFLERFPGSVINVHPALLPQFPGAHAIEDALAAGVPVTGATVHYVDEGVDTGDVIRQREVRVLDGDTVETLRARIQAVEHELLPSVVQELCAL